MKQVINISVEIMPNGAHNAFMQSTLKRVKNDTALRAKTHLVPLIANFESCFQTEEEKFKLSQKSLYTDTLNELDQRRDNAYMGFKGIVESYGKVPDAELQQASKALGQLITDYRIDIRAQRDQETGLLSNFISDLEGKCASHVQTLQAGKAVQCLKSANDNYITTREERTEERMQKQIKALATARTATDEAYRGLVAMVNALAMVEGEADYADFIDYMNTLINEYKEEVLGQNTKPATPSLPEDGGTGDDGQQPTPDAGGQPDTGGDEPGGNDNPGGNTGDEEDEDGGLAG